MTKKQATENIKNAIKQLNIKRSDSYTMGDMDKIVKLSGTNLYCVMSVLRYGKII